jgi:hypothetical protein
MEEFKKFEITVGQLVDAGLIAISLIILQDWISLGIPDPSSFVSLIAIAVAIPMLVFDLLIRRIPNRHAANKLHFFYIRMISILGAIVAGIGIAAAMWHISWIVGVIFLCISIFCFFVYVSSFTATETALKKEEQQKSH